MLRSWQSRIADARAWSDVGHAPNLSAWYTSRACKENRESDLGFDLSHDGRSGTSVALRDYSELRRHDAAGELPSDTLPSPLRDAVCDRLAVRCECSDLACAARGIWL